MSNGPRESNYIRVGAGSGKTGQAAAVVACIQTYKTYNTFDYVFEDRCRQLISSSRWTAGMTSSVFSRARAFEDRSRIIR
jgi:hypothetical protein